MSKGKAKMKSIKWRVLTAIMATGVAASFGMPQVFADEIPSLETMMSEFQSPEQGGGVQHFNDYSWYGKGNTSWSGSVASEKFPHNPNEDDEFNKFGAVGGWGYFAHGEDVFAQQDGQLNNDTSKKLENVAAMQNKNTMMSVIGGSPYVIVGGNQLMGVGVTKDQQTAIDEAKTVTKGSETYIATAGNYVVSDAKYTTANLSGTTKKTSMSVEGHKYYVTFGGSIAERTGMKSNATTGTVKVSDDDVSLSVKNAKAPMIFAGGAAMGNGTTSIVKNTTLTLSGTLRDDSDERKNVDPKDIGVNVYAGGFAQAGGTTKVENATIIIDNLNSDITDIISGGFVQRGNNEMEGDINFIDSTGQDTLTTTSSVDNATIHMKSGTIRTIVLQGYSYDENKDSDRSHYGQLAGDMQRAVINYDGGTIKEAINIGKVTDNAVINLKHDLKTGKISTGEDTKVTVNGDAKYAVEANIEQLKGDITLSGLSNLKGNVKVDKGASATVDLSAMKSFTGVIEGAGAVTLSNGLEPEEEFEVDKAFTFTKDLQVNNEHVVLTKGAYQGTFNLEKNITVDKSAAVAVNDFTENVLGKGKIILNEGGLKTSFAQLFGDKAGDATVDTDGAKVLPKKLSEIADRKFAVNKSGYIYVETEMFSLKYIDAAREALNKKAKDDGAERLELNVKGKLVGKMSAKNIRELDKYKDIIDFTETGKGTTIDTTQDEKINLYVYEDGKNAPGAINSEAIPSANVVNLNLKAGSDAITIDGGQLQIAGTSTGDTVLVDGKKPTALKVVLGVDNGGNFSKGTLALGEKGSNKSIVLSAEVEVNKDSNVQTMGNVAIDKVTLKGGQVDAVDGELVAKVTAVENSESVITGVISIPELSLENETTMLQIGTNSKTASGTMEKVALNGDVLLLDPAWTEKAANVAVDFTTTKGDETIQLIDGKLLVGQNTYATIGSEADAATMFKQTGLKFGEKDITAALHIRGNQTLGEKGAVYVDGSKVDTDLKDAAKGVAVHSFTAAANSVTMVDGEAIQEVGKAALSHVKTVAIDKNAKLYINDAKGNQTYHILLNDGQDAIAGLDKSQWTKDNIISNKMLVDFDVQTDDNKAFNVVTKWIGAGALADKSSMVSVVNQSMKNDKLVANTLFNAIMDNKVNATEEAQANALNSVANMTALAGVTRGAYTSQTVFAGAMTEHMSATHVMTPDKDVWAHIIHAKDKVRDVQMDFMEGSYDAKYNGIVVGADLYQAKYKKAGLAFSYLDGDVTGQGNATSTNAKYYGVGAYGRWDLDKVTILADASYMYGSHDVTQYNSKQKITGDVKTDAFSIGMRAEKALAYGKNATFVSYVGARFVHLGTQEYTNNFGLKYTQNGQNFVVIPVGVSYTSNHKHGAWNIRPMIDLGYVLNAGNRAANQRISLDGAVTGFDYDVVDRGSFLGKVGVEAENGRASYALSYERQQSSHQKANRFQANMAFKF